MSPAVRDLWARTTLRLWPEPLVLASLDRDDVAEAARFLAAHPDGFGAVVVERDEVSLTVAATAWDRRPAELVARTVAGPYRAVTFDLDIDLGVCGYLLPAAERLADAGISIVPQCGYLKDHLVIRERDADRAVAVLESLMREARGE